jgi:hypothetical protein
VARRKPKPAPLRYESHLFEIGPLNPSYSVSLADPKRERGIYREYWHLELEGRCMAPARLAGRLTRLLFIAERLFFERPASVDKDWRPFGVGHLTMKGDRSEYLGSLPFDALWGLANAIAAGTFKYVTMHGPALKYGSCSITGVSFVASYDPDNY